MLIDGFTTLAQIINFSILVFLLQRFLYKPITQAMTERQARVAHDVETAAQQAAAAKQEAEHYRQQQRELESQKQQWLEQAQQEVTAQKQQWLEQAQQNLEATRASWIESLGREQQQRLQDLKRQVGQRVLAIARQVLVDLAGANLEQQIASTFADRLSQLNGSQLQVLQAEQSAQTPRELEIRSTFPITEETQCHISSILRQRLTADLAVKFETDAADGICGIELHDRNCKIAWNLADYLADLEADLERSLAG